jgi:beta-glucosidase
MPTRRSFVLTAAAALRLKAAAAPQFLIGAGSAAHQVEGNNTNTDLWLMEHAAPQLFREKSGDACDHYHRYAEDIRLLASLGLRAYRFSVEWARVEPERGEFSQAVLDHYRNMAQVCRDNGIAPMVTLYHFTTPLWLAREGGWERADMPALFARYAQRVGKAMGDLPLGYGTINEINVPPYVKRQAMANPALAQLKQGIAAASKSPEFSSFLFADSPTAINNILSAHTQAVAALRAENSRPVVGLTLAMRDHQAIPGGEERLREIQKTDYEPYFELAQKDDYIGVQSYTRTRVRPAGETGPEASSEKTQSGSEYYPKALENTLRYVHAKTKKPLWITENGIPTMDDAQRIRFIREALDGVKRCLSDGIDVRGYFHWSALDSYEWIYGYNHSYGLISVDRKTFARTPKKSAEYLGQIARAGL